MLCLNYLRHKVGQIDPRNDSNESDLWTANQEERFECVLNMLIELEICLYSFQAMEKKNSG